MKVLIHADALVMPWRGADSRFQFAHVGSREARVFVGPVADVAERDISCVLLAELDAPLMGTEAQRFVASIFMQDLAWLQSVPVGSRVRLTRTGTMDCEVSADRDWFVKDSIAWAKRQRRAGLLPVLVELPGGRFQVVALAGQPSLKLVDLSELLLRMRTVAGCADAVGVEVL